MRIPSLAVCCFIFTAALSGGAQAQVAPAAPWDDQTQEAVATEEDDLGARPLTLKDLETLLPSAGQSAGLSANKTATPLEALYSRRADAGLELFGYDLFKTGEKPSDRIPAGAIGDDYLLGQGDTLELTLRGQENSRKTYTINAQGLLVTDLFPARPAAGKTLGALRKALQDEAAAMHNVSVDLTLSNARQIDVLVIGDVINPGRKTLTPFHTALDALTEAGGIRKTGSLRKIKLVRTGQSRIIDLYAVMMQGTSTADTRLQDGDRIIVPPIGPTLAITGAVKRPAIYELRSGQNLSTLEALGLAGGVLVPGDNRFLSLALTGDGEEIVEEIEDPSKRRFGDGGILSVAQAQEKRSRNITLSGHTRTGGEHALDKARTLSALIKSDRVFGDSLYPLIGVIARKDPQTLTRVLVEFSPQQVVQKNSDIPLNEGDSVHLFSEEQIRNLQSHKEETPSNDLLQKVSYSQEKNAALDDPAIVSFLRERSAFVRGAVRHPGAYPVAAGTPLPALVAAAGGPTVEADPAQIEVTTRAIALDEEDAASTPLRRMVSLHDQTAQGLTIAAGETVRVNQKFNRVEDQSVILLGEVKNPGKYDLMPGDTLSNLLTRAGGLTEIAYPDGVIFSRASERKQEEARYKAQARDLEMKIAESLRSEDKEKKPNDAQVSAAQTIIAQLREAKAVGRITVEADPDVLASDPEQNILLEAGDKIYIPRRPLTVRVGGEVLSPAALQFRKGKDAQTYIEEAGGTTYFADTDRAFVVYPDGSAKPLSVSAWRQSVTMIPPGSTIIVPRDPKPFDFLESAETISTILANIALTGFYLDDLGDDD